MDDSGLDAGPRCLWCGEPLGEGSPRHPYCARPCLCRDRAYRDRRPAKAAMPGRLALARANAARAVLSGRVRARAKAGDGPVQIARMHKLTKASALKARTQAINQLKSVLVTADPALREELAGLGNAELFRTCARFADMSGHEEGGEEPVLRATRITLGLLAQRIGRLSEQIRNVDARLTRLVECHAPQLLDVVGIGPDTAVALLITVGDNPERLDSEASFAALCGVSPVERSSGRRQFRRLNRGGDRQANAVLHRIVFTRLRVDPRTRDYYERRIKEGKTRREIVRCLKRYAAREVFHLVRQLQPGPRS